MKGIDIEMVSENAVIAGGKPFTVGVKIHHHEGYHTYWQNPGIAGVPVKLEWKLPEGFSAGPIQWPHPEKSMMAIHPVHGFERDVMLLVEITPPAKLESTRVGLKATASWMACADGCYPGRKELSCEVTAGDAAKPDPILASAFEKARTELPKPLEGWKVEALSEIDAPEVKLRLIPAAGQIGQVKELYFFSSDGQISSDPPQRVTKFGDGFEITAERSAYGPKGQPKLPGVLMVTTAADGGQAFGTIEPAFPGGSAKVVQASPTPAAAKECDCEK